MRKVQKESSWVLLVKYNIPWGSTWIKLRLSRYLMQFVHVLLFLWHPVAVILWNVETLNCFAFSAAGRKATSEQQAVGKLQRVKKKSELRQYIQNSACLKLRPVLRCRECQSKKAQHNTNEHQAHQCRFYSFRRYTSITVIDRLHRYTIRYDMRCYFNVRTKADTSQLNLLCGTKN